MILIIVPSCFVQHLTEDNVSACATLPQMKSVSVKGLVSVIAQSKQCVSNFPPCSTDWYQHHWGMQNQNHFPFYNQWLNCGGHRGECYTSCTRDNLLFIQSFSLSVEFFSGLKEAGGYPRKHRAKDRKAVWSIHCFSKQRRTLFFMEMDKIEYCEMCDFMSQ